MNIYSSPREVKKENLHGLHLKQGVGRVENVLAGAQEKFSLAELYFCLT